MIETLWFIDEVLILEEIRVLAIDVGNSVLIEGFQNSTVLQQTTPILARLTLTASTMRMDGKCIACASGEDWASRVATLGVTIITYTC